MFAHASSAMPSPLHSSLSSLLLLPQHAATNNNHEVIPQPFILNESERKMEKNKNQYSRVMLQRVMCGTTYYVRTYVSRFLEPEKDLIEREETLFKNEKKYKDGIALH